MADRSWRLARSLERLRAQIDERFPGRSKRSDGTIGDARHRSRESDHNPWLKDGKTGIGVVSALDITHDINTGVDTWQIAEWLRQRGDPRIKYCISNHRIFSSTTQPWQWRRYLGANPHSHHIHISVRSTRAYYDDASDWDLFGGMTIAPPEPQDAPDPDSPATRLILRRGASGEMVRMVQRLLVLDQIDGHFGPLTEQAVRAFQRREKIGIDGVVGPATWAKLDLVEQIPVPFNYDVPRPLSEPEV